VPARAARFGAGSQHARAAARTCRRRKPRCQRQGRATLPRPRFREQACEGARDGAGRREEGLPPRKLRRHADSGGGQGAPEVRVYWPNEGPQSNAFSSWPSLRACLAFVYLGEQRSPQNRAGTFNPSVIEPRPFRRCSVSASVDHNSWRHIGQVAHELGYVSDSSEINERVIAWRGS
jgi:hypothetical protein